MKARDDLEPGFDLIPARRASPLIYAVAHAGRSVPASASAQLQADAATIRSLEDPLVDRLIAGAEGLGANILINRTARAYIDVNRDPEEIDPRLVTGGAWRETPRTRAGLGVVPRLGGDGKTLYRGRLPLDEVRRRIETVHRPYHAALAQLMMVARDVFGLAVLVDWHSMPALAAEAERRRGGLKPDIVLGDRYGQSAALEYSGVVRAAFEGRGQQVAMNRPFAGGYTTQCWARPDEGFHALQVEIDRSVYLEGVTLEPGPRFEALQTDIAVVGQALMTRLESKKAAPESAA